MAKKISNKELQRQIIEIKKEIKAIYKRLEPLHDFMIKSDVVSAKDLIKIILALISVLGAIVGVSQL